MLTNELLVDNNGYVPDKIYGFDRLRDIMQMIDNERDMIAGQSSQNDPHHYV